jgi:TonB-linked SusC/RagA family outer membrane protein
MISNSSPKNLYYQVLVCFLLFCSFAAGTLYAQSPPDAKSIVRGTVVDEKGRFLKAVSVKVKGTEAGTATDVKGSFVLPVPGFSVTLEFSHIGYAMQDIALNGRQTLIVTLTPISNDLNSVIVIGYGSVNRKDLTGSVSKVNMADLAKAPVKSFDEALAGRVAGVDVTTNDGQPGASPNIVIRGSNSITQDNSPLYVIDGFPIENPDNNVINPADIESIEILKDASATAIYGSRGANGVVIITTKRGKKQDPTISYTGSYGVQEDFNRPVMMNPYQFVKYQLLSNPDAPGLYLSNGKTLESYANVKGIDMQDLMLRRAAMFNNSLSIRGGNERTQYSISLSALNQQGIIINSGFNRYQGRINLDQTVNPKLKVGINLNYSNTKSFGTIVTSGNSNTTTNIMFQMLSYRPVTGGDNDAALADSLYDPDLGGMAIGDYRINPYLSAKNELNQRIGNDLMVNGYLQYKITQDLTLRLSGGIDNNWGRTESFNNSFTSTGNPRFNAKGPNGSVGNALVSNWVSENTLTYNKRFNKKHSLNILAGFTAQKTSYINSRLTASQVPNESMGIDGLDEGATQSISSSSSRNTLVSFLGRVTYNLLSKYLFTFSLRQDGSSKFAPGHRWGVFPSGGFAWQLGEEKFMHQFNFISGAKFRATYGVTGNNRVSDFPYLSTLGLPVTSAYSFNNGVPVNGVSLTALGSPDLTWETTAQADLGLDLDFFHDRLSFTADVYRKTTSNLLLYATLPFTTGFDAGYKNIGKMQNQGLELSLSSVNVQNKKFKWTSSFNISFNSNKVLGLTENQESILSAVPWDANFGNALYMAKIGQPVAQFYGLIWDGVYQFEDFNAAPDGKYYLKNNIPTNGKERKDIKPGDIKYKDLNGDGVVDTKDFTVIGRALAVHKGGFGNNFTYKGFGLNIFFQWSYGNDIFNNNRLIYEGNARGVVSLNQYASYAKYWTAENPSNTLFRPNGQGPSFYSTRTLEDGSYLRLKTVSLEYNVPDYYLSRLKVKALRVYVSAQNLLTITGYSGRDPDVSTRNSTLTPGFDWSAYPIVRTIVGGINVEF